MKTVTQLYSIPILSTQIKTHIMRSKFPKENDAPGGRVVQRKKLIAGASSLPDHIRNPGYIPREEEALVVKGLQPVPCPQEYLLGQVFHCAALRQNVVTDIEHTGLVAHDKLTKRLGVTATGALDQGALMATV